MNYVDTYTDGGHIFKTYVYVSEELEAPRFMAELLNKDGSITSKQAFRELGDAIAWARQRIQDGRVMS